MISRRRMLVLGGVGVLAFGTEGAGAGNTGRNACVTTEVEAAEGELGDLAGQGHADDRLAGGAGYRRDQLLDGGRVRVGQGEDLLP